jgi:hypothetical protein
MLTNVGRNDRDIRIASGVVLIGPKTLWGLFRACPTPRGLLSRLQRR